MIPLLKELLFQVFKVLMVPFLCTDRQALEKLIQ